MGNIITALIGAIAGLAAIWFGFSFHVGSWFVEGSWGAVRPL
jgi:hypothetical protein